MITKDMLSILKRVRVGITMIGLLCLMYPVCGQAAQFNFDAKVVELKAKFPQGKYWNHVGMDTENVDGYTESPCALHKTSGIHISGTDGCTCNHYVDASHGGSATQCMGFAYKLGFDVFGQTAWTTNYVYTLDQMTGISKGDIIRINGNHSAFVINRNGNVLTIGEANYPNGCQINWDRQVDITAVKITYYERANNYDFIMGGGQPGSTEIPATETGGSDGTTEAPATETPTTEGSNPNPATTEDPATGLEVTENGQPYTGWKDAGDGIHYKYYEAGKLQKNKWITIEKKKYYVDENGYRVTGFHDVKQQTYFFDTTGVMKKEEWFQSGDATYYVNEQGIVLKNQWLWYDGGSVYVTADGSIARKELVKIGSQTYLFNAKGKRSKGFKNLNGKYYYCNSKGIIQKKKWITKNGKKYYLQKSGVRAQSKLVKIGKYRYYFDKKGRMVKNKRVTYKGKIYKANKKGYCTYIAAANVTD